MHAIGIEDVFERRVYGFERTVTLSAVSFRSALSLHDVIPDQSSSQLHIDNLSTIIMERV